MANIFQALGLQEDHRTRDKCTMKVKHVDLVPDSKKPDTLYYGQIKKDGIYCHVLKHNNIFALYSRTGLELANCWLLRSQLATKGRHLPSGVYIAELCCDNKKCSLEALSGIFNPNRTKPLDETQAEWMNQSYLAFHDYLTREEFIQGKSEATYQERYKKLSVLFPNFQVLRSTPLPLNGFESFAEEVIADGEEGVVFKRPDEIWVAGHKGYRMMKKVRYIDYDLLCVGAEEGTGKYAGKVVNLIFQWRDGKIVKAMLGKGWTHEDAEQMYQDWQLSVIDNPVGQIFQVYALQESSKGILRLPKVGELRFDKEVADV